MPKLLSVHADGKKSHSESLDRDAEQNKITCYVKLLYNLGTAVAQWLRCCATNRKVAGSFPTICLVAVITLRNLHFISTRKAGSPGLDGLLETVTMEETTDVRQAEATC